MATLEELYRYYLNQPITYVPGSTIGGLSSLTEINRNDSGGLSSLTEINRNDSGGDSSESSNTVSVNSTPGKGITSISYSDMAKAFGFAMNPALGIANMVATEVFGKSPMSMAMDALGFGGSDSSSTGTANATDTGDMGSEAANNAATDAANASVGAGGDSGGSDSTSTGTANATDTGDMGSEAANNAATDAANASVGAGGDGGSSSDGGSTGSDGPFRDGGRVGLYDGGSAFDNYRAPQLMNNRIYYLQGGLASLLR
jgi:hypothetical protein